MTTAKMRWYNCLLALAVAGTLPACGTSDKPVPSGGPLSGLVTVDWSATVFPLSKTMAEAFRESNPAVQFAFIENRKIVLWRDYMDSLAAWIALNGTP
jgi:ABC-type phosphate transport system substrate-binding protein